MKIQPKLTYLATAISIALAAAPSIGHADTTCNIHSAPSSITASGTTAYVNPAYAILGSTPTQVHERFAGIVEQNFRTGNTNKIIHNLSGRELADLAAVYKNATSTPSTLLEILAKVVDADGLASVASAFGQEETAAAVARYAPAAVAKAFTQVPVKIAAERSVQVSKALAAAASAAVASSPDSVPIGTRRRSQGSDSLYDTV